MASLNDTVPMIKSDTQGSSRSFRGTIKNKISSSKEKDKDKDSPTGSSAALPGSPLVEKSDPMQTIGQGKRRTSSLSATPAPSASSSQKSLAVNDGNNLTSPSSVTSASTTEPTSPTSEDSGNLTPPLSPVRSSSVGKGHHAFENTDVDNVSEAPPGTSEPPPPTNQQPKESILIKRAGAVIPINTTGKDAIQNGAGSVGGSPSMGMSALRSIDLDDMITRLLDAAYTGKVTKTVCLKNAEITAICSAAREVFLSQPSLIELSPSVKIVGDVHGQYTDLIRMFEMCGFPPNSNYLFLGDYVDRGKQSLETILLLMCYKLKFPENFFLLRGNHECANVTRGGFAIWISKSMNFYTDDL